MLSPWFYFYAVVYVILLVAGYNVLDRMPSPRFVSLDPGRPSFVFRRMAMLSHIALLLSAVYFWTKSRFLWSFLVTINVVIVAGFPFMFSISRKNILEYILHVLMTIPILLQPGSLALAPVLVALGSLILYLPLIRMIYFLRA